MTTCTACDLTTAESCTWCGAAVCNTHVQFGQPFISARQLATATATTAIRTPSLLGDMLFKELSQVPYCESCREELAAKRTTEQLKVLLGLLVLIGIVVGLPMYFALVG